MPPIGADRWFHTLVVLGAALGGCGGKTLEHGGPATTSSGGAENVGGGSATAGQPSQAVGGGASLRPEACAFHTQFVCDDYAALSSCRCDPASPHTPSDCPSPFDFVCTEIPCQPSPTQICLGPIEVGCHCDPAAPRPTDCETPEQFFCQTVAPHWRDCACRPERSADPGSCRAGEYCCQSSDPRFGCGCCRVDRIK